MFRMTVFPNYADLQYVIASWTAFSTKHADGTLQEIWQSNNRTWLISTLSYVLLTLELA